MMPGSPPRRSRRPLLVDYDGDGDLDLFVGSQSSGLAYYRNDGTRQVAEFIMADPAPVTMDVGAPAAGDVDLDGDVDLIAGTTSGGLRFLRNDRLTTSVEHPHREREAVRIISVFPNPADAAVTILLQLSSPSDVRVALSDILGRTVVEYRLRMSSGAVTAGFPVTSLARGLYVLRVQTAGGYTHARKVVLQ